MQGPDSTGTTSGHAMRGEQAAGAPAAAAAASAPAATMSGPARLLSAPALLLAAVVLLALALLLAFAVAPTDVSTMGFSQKIFYFHAPVAETALVAYAVALVAGILYLRRGDPAYDELGRVAVRAGLFFSVLVMITGMIWGKAAWGAWWAWEPRLTTFLVACLLYGGYFVARAALDDEERRATVAAVFAIIAFIDVPVTFFATRLLPEGLHPVVITAGGFGMTGGMAVTFIVAMAGMMLLLAGMLRADMAAYRLRSRIEDLTDALEEE